MKKTKVLVNGYGVIGKRVAEAVSLQDDMELVGVSDIAVDYRIKIAQSKGHNIYASTEEAVSKMKEAGIETKGTLSDVLKEVEIVIDATPKGIGAKNKTLYDNAGVKSVFQGGESDELTGFSFVAQANFDGARGKQSVRCVSCNTTGLTRVIHTLHKEGLVKKVRATLIRRGTDPWESHINGLINTVVPENKIPSHQGPDVETVLSGLDITTIAAKGPFNLSHMHTIFIELTRDVSLEEVIKLYKGAPRIAFVNTNEGVAGLNSVIEIMRDIGRKRNDMWEVAIWEDIMKVSERDFMVVYQVNNESIVVPENIDAIRALSDTSLSAEESIKKTDESLGIVKKFY